ncbi:hypothetical protein FPV67DRAFT_1221856 [Lyophyllum atratum]|nr:hypothetical protein FPV67DRAFT_1221856 [Lyophyllum atratum]
MEGRRHQSSPLPRPLTDAIPLEIHEIIIDFLHLDPRSLSACALVCKAWRPASQHHLLHKITIKRHTYRRFLHLLHESPDFRRMVQARVHTLTVTQEPRVSRCWLHDFIPHLAGFIIKNLIIDRRNAGDPTNYDIVPHARIFRDSFQSLTELKLYQAKFNSLTHLVAMICSLRDLESLSLDSVTWVRWEAGSPSVERYRLPRRLHDLTINLRRHDGTLTQFMEWIQQYEGDDLPRLRTLSIRSQFSEGDGYEFIPMATWVFVNIGVSLRDLTVANFYDPREGTTYPAIFTCNAELRKLCICDIDLRWYKPSGNARQRAESRLSWIPLFVGQVAGTNIEVLEFEIWLKEVDHLQLLGLDEMGRMFMRPEFAKLKRIELKVSAPEKAVKRWIGTNLPLELMKRGAIHVSRLQ